MKTTKLITTILLTIFLVSCKGPRIKPQVIGDISFQFERCRLTCFDIMKMSSTRKEKCNITKKIPKEFPIFYSEEYDEEGDRYLKFNPGNYSLQVCDGLIGFHVDTYATKVKPWGKKVIQYCKDKGC